MIVVNNRVYESTKNDILAERSNQAIYHSYKDGKIVKMKVTSDGSNLIGTMRFISKDKKARGPRSELNKIFDKIYYDVVQNVLGEAQIFYTIVEKMKNIFGDFVNEYDEEGEAFTVEKYSKKRIEELHKLSWARLKRFQRKVALYPFNYYITLTRNDEFFSNEKDWDKSIRKSMQNFCTRRGWRYCMVPERGKENGRLHYHAWLFVPKGQMVGEISLKKDYNKKTGKITTRMGNSFFDENYGNSDFQYVSANEKKLGNITNYITKYILKQGAKAIYSRHIPEFIEKEITKDDVALEYLDFCIKYILADYVLDDEDFISDETDFPLRL